MNALPNIHKTEKHVPAMYAWAREMFPPRRPSRILLANSIVAFVAVASMAKEINVPITQTINNGLLPYLSDRAPIIGTATNCAAALLDWSNPISIGVIPYSVVRYGNNGSTILNPKTSIKTNRKRENRILIFWLPRRAAGTGQALMSV